MFLNNLHQDTYILNSSSKIYKQVIYLQYVFFGFSLPKNKLIIMMPLEESLQRAKETLQPEVIEPFENIALSFSGGGFRAAAYSLGVLSYLNSIELSEEAGSKTLLEKVSYISSASGGTIANSVYAFYNSKGISFDEYYKKFAHGLDGDHLLKSALNILNSPAEWAKRKNKSRNLINACSIAYDKYFFDGGRIGDISADEIANPVSHLEEVCFNTTEFIHGLLFTQQVKLQKDSGEDPHFYYGNFSTHLNRDISNKIYLGDIVAASSCFPAGFEPFIFPLDFAHSKLTPDQLRGALHLEPQKDDLHEREFLKQATFGLMDGGITDNHGLESMMHADRRRQEGKTSFRHFDLMLVNDVSSHYISPYAVQAADPTAGGMSLVKFSLLLGAIFLLSDFLIYYAWEHDYLPLLVPVSFTAISSFCLLMIIFFSLRSLKRRTKKTTGFNLSKTLHPTAVKTFLKFLQHTPLKVLFQMLSARSNSMFILSNDVFMKRIRQLLYNSFYNSPQWQNRGKGNRVYDLSFSNDINRKRDDDKYPTLKPSRAIQIVAETSYAVGTALWFEENDNLHFHKKASLISCGQFTTCYNLLMYVERLFVTPDVMGSLVPQHISRLNYLRKRLTSDYEHFKMDPFFLYTETNKRLGLKDNKDLKVKDIPFPANFQGIR